MSSYVELLKWLRLRPGNYVGSTRFDVIAGYLQGLDAGNEGGLLQGFREFLVMKADDGVNLVWVGLVLLLALPDDQYESQSEFASPEAEKKAVDTLFDLLEEFMALRKENGGLRRIFRDYEKWLRQQDWYDPSRDDGGVPI